MADIETSVEGGLQTIRMARPGKKNALTTAMYAAMVDALRTADDDPEIVTNLFVGSDGVFSAGNDIGDFMESARSGVGLGGPVLEFIRLLPRVRKPMIAAVDGLAVGIGTTMLFHCDLVYATPAARFSTPFLNLGLVPEAGSSLMAPRQLGYPRAFEMLVLGETFTAERAREAGLVNAVVPADELEKTARSAAARLAAKPPDALAIARRLLRGDVAALSACIEEEARQFRDRMTSPEAQEAFAAFFEKRPADFKAVKRG